MGDDIAGNMLGELEEQVKKIVEALIEYRKKEKDWEKKKEELKKRLEALKKKVEEFGSD